jgi:DNA-binding MarR family transcriptional regulator
MVCKPGGEVPFDQSDSATHSQAQLGRGEAGGPLSHRLSYIRIMHLVHFVKRGSNHLYSRISGLSDFEWRLLTRVCETPGLSITELSALMERGAAQVSRAAKRLVGQGLLRRENVGGGPRVRISATPKGQRVYAPLVKAAFQSERDLTAGLDDEDRKALDRIIAVMTHNALDRLAREQQLAGPDEIARKGG